MSIAGQCPSCGAPIAFHVSSSLVTVCEHCNTVVARTDRAFEDLGKTSDLLPTQSGLALWLTGKYRGVGFQITGRAQLEHGAGGVWDEWYMAFDDGRWGWLAEAQGKFYVTFRQEQGPSVALGQLRPGADVVVPGQDLGLVVAEVGAAKVLAGRGEIPYTLETGRSYPYADLSGPDGIFATLDGGDEPPALFLGREVSRDDLHLAGDGQADFDADAPQVATQAVSCDNCGGSLELRAPERTERVACPYCGSLHDLDRGILRLLDAKPSGKRSPSLPLGAKARFPIEGKDHEFTLIGFMVRQTRDDFGQLYEWEEYLLYNPGRGFRWLVYNDKHWSFVAPINVGDVRAPLPDDIHSAGETADYQGKTYKLFQAGPAKVACVAGEFYWRVEMGQTTHTADYIRPPEMLSGESGLGEINWSLVTYMSAKEIDAAFGEAVAPAGYITSVAPNQPFRHKGAYAVWAVFMVLAIAMFFWAKAKNPARTVHTQNFELPAQGTPENNPGKVEPDVLFSDEFGLAADQNIQVRMYSAQVNNGWLYAQADLYNTETGAVYAFDVPIEYYYGVADGESWSEGGRVGTRMLSSVPAGIYTMRLMVERSQYAVPHTLEVNVVQGVMQLRYWLYLLIGISIIPILVGVYHFFFERRRWANSDFSGGDE